jgi:methionine salvage enolase-phosphatase E1
MKFTLRDCVWASLIVLLFVEVVRHERALAKSQESVVGLWEAIVEQEHRLFRIQQQLDSDDSNEAMIQQLQGNVWSLHERVGTLEKRLPDRRSSEE